MLIYSTFIHTCQNSEAFRNSRWLSAGERTNCGSLSVFQTVEHYSVLERNELSSHEKPWRKFKLLSERSWSEKATPRKIPTIEHCGKRRNYEDGIKISGCWGLGRRGRVRGAPRIFRVVQMLSGILPCWIQVITCWSQTTEGTIPRATLMQTMDLGWLHISVSSSSTRKGPPWWGAVRMWAATQVLVQEA